MATSTVGAYAPSRKTWDHIGGIFPGFQHSEGVRPQFETIPAPWLPLLFVEKWLEVGVVATQGTPLALDQRGYLVPAGLSKATTLTYAQTDVDNGVIDITTGSALTATKTVTLANVDGSTSSYLGNTGEALSISQPIGFAATTFLQWAGGDGFNPVDYAQHNFNMQHRATVLCDYVCKLPLVPASASSEDLGGTTLSNTAITFGTKGLKSRTGILATSRYSGLSSSLTAIAYVFDNYPVATKTVRTPIKFHESTTSTTEILGLLVSEQTSAADVTAAGDYYVDYDFGVIFLYSADGATLPSGTDVNGTVYDFGSTQGGVSYSHYAAAASTVSKFTCVLGDPKPGDFLTFNSDSNLIVETPSVASASAANSWISGRVAQVLWRDASHPKDYLDRVKTAYSSLSTTSSALLPGYAGQDAQMPGSATGGVPNSLQYAGGADTEIVINLIGR